MYGTQQNVSTDPSVTSWYPEIMFDSFQQSTHLKWPFLNTVQFFFMNEETEMKSRIQDTTWGYFEVDKILLSFSFHVYDCI